MEYFLFYSVLVLKFLKEGYQVLIAVMGRYMKPLDN